MGDVMFDDLNHYGKNLKLLKARTAEDLQKQIESITLPVYIKFMYYADGMHIAWIMTQAKVVKSKKETK